MTGSAYGLHGAALLDHERGAPDMVLGVEQEGARDDVPAAFWFRREIDTLEQAALDLCRGRILDLGAGTGVHALRLQHAGHAVTAIEVEPACVEIMRRRGVRDARQADLLAFEGGPFDTLISLCNGLDKVGRLADLPRFLAQVRALLAPGGQFLADSFDLRVGADDAARKRFAAREVEGRFWGEMDLRFLYRGETGAPFTVLHVDAGTLSDAARAEGLGCEVLRQEGGHYLARLEPK